MHSGDILFDFLIMISVLPLLLAYINCTKGFHCDISVPACSVPWSNSPSLLRFFKQILMDFIILLSYMCSLTQTVLFYACVVIQTFF
jgi:hypothetical protein